MEKYRLMKIFEVRDAPHHTWKYILRWWNGQQRYVSWIVDTAREGDPLSPILVERGAENGEFVLLDMD